MKELTLQGKYSGVTCSSKGCMWIYDARDLTWLPEARSTVGSDD